MTWSLGGGTDVARFAINASTGVLTFVAPQDYEIPTDSDGNRTYQVQVRATGPGGTSNQLLTVTVLDVLEPVISATKTVRVIAEAGAGVDCATSPQLPGAEAAAPGACLEYTITVLSAPNGASAVSNVQVVDVLPTNMLLVAANENAGFTSLMTSGNTVTGTLGSLSAGVQASFKIRAVLQRGPTKSPGCRNDQGGRIKIGGIHFFQGQGSGWGETRCRIGCGSTGRARPGSPPP